MAASMDEVVVSATRTEQRLSDVLADMTVIGHEEIERSGFSDLATILARQPGVQLVRTGGLGSSTSLFMRGANNQHTAVFVDGIRVDSQSTSGGMDWQTIPVASIDRVEILRGPAAAVYGSDAVAGVIQIFTKKGETGFLPHIAIGFGNQGTRKADAGLSGGKARGTTQSACKPSALMVSMQKRLPPATRIKMTIGCMQPTRSWGCS